MELWLQGEGLSLEVGLPWCARWLSWVTPVWSQGLQPKRQPNGCHLGLLQMLRTQDGCSWSCSYLLPSGVYINSHGYTFSTTGFFFFFKGKQVLWHSSHITHRNRQCQILRTTNTIGIIQNIKPRQQHLTAGVVWASWIPMNVSWWALGWWYLPSPPGNLLNTQIPGCPWSLQPPFLARFLEILCMSFPWVP